MTKNIKEIFAIQSNLEELATRCLSSAVLAISYRRLENEGASDYPTNEDASDAGRVAVGMAIAIRANCSERIREILISKEAGEYLEKLAAQIISDQQA